MQEHPILSFGPLKSYFLLGKIQNEGQPAGNFNSFSTSKSRNLGSSETTREVYNLKDNLFKSWFIGFLEGKGFFLISKSGDLEFKLVHSTQDAQILFFIKKKLGFGIVRIQDKTKNTHCYKIKDKHGLLTLISIINGNLFLNSNKTQFNLWLTAFNKKYGTSIVYLENINKFNILDSWLCGFTDAIGRFILTINNNPEENLSVKLSYILVQKKDNYDQIKYLADILKGKINLEKNPEFCNVTIHTTKLSTVIKYFNIYPLKTKKSIIYLNWKKSYILITNKKHLTNKELNLLIRYKTNLNRLEKII
uniref:Homing endonuclease LAGLIDADG domain-containing protein n=1 Tax=Dactylella sp. TaxID=1814903 RepID=A0A482DQR6_9PEZI|nr:hypothetical protein [Dactylella sp.]